MSGYHVSESPAYNVVMLSNSLSAEYAGVCIEKAYMPGPWGQIHYYAAGTGPCLILAHQSPVCGRMFEQALSRLVARGIREIAVDTPCYGMSDVPQSLTALSEYADSFAWVASEADFVKNRV